MGPFRGTGGRAARDVTYGYEGELIDPQAWTAGARKRAAAQGRLPEFDFMLH
jgi:hypothetical protein